MFCGTESVKATSESNYHSALDALEVAMISSGAVIDQPLTHLFVPGLYVRRIFNPAGSLITTKIHRTEHPFILLRGRVTVMLPDRSIEELSAPHFGITAPGTRRVIYVHEDTVWITIHPNPDDTHDLSIIEDHLIDRRELLDGHTAHELYTAALQQYGELLS